MRTIIVLGLDANPARGRGRRGRNDRMWMIVMTRTIAKQTAFRPFFFFENEKSGLGWHLHALVGAVHRTLESLGPSVARGHAQSEG